MSHSIRLAFFRVPIIIALLAIAANAQESSPERAASLRAQLVDVQAKQGELQLQLQQLEEDLKPENIEHSLAGVGSTHPEDLREARRRQLEGQKKGVQSQLDSLAATRIRLEAAIARADVASYHESAGVGTSPGQSNVARVNTTNNGARPHKRHRVKKRKI